MRTLLVTGVAGFIGSHVALRLLEAGEHVVGIDRVDDYYDVRLKEARLARLTAWPTFTLYRDDLADAGAIAAVFARHTPAGVVHLAAQPGVRHSLTHPRVYVDSNVVGFLNILEACRHHGVTHLLYASSSSVYGANTGLPFSEHVPADHPLSLYAATKRANELMAHSYSHLFGLPTTGLRLFTVYGPWGRPDMALFSFTRAILANEPIRVFNHGRMRRDFTYVDDVVESVIRLVDRPARPDPAWRGDNPDPAHSNAPFVLYNIGNSQPCDLMEYIGALEEALGRTAEKVFDALQPGDVSSTWADTSDLEAVVGTRPSTPVREGVARFVAWYRDYYGV